MSRENSADIEKAIKAIRRVAVALMTEREGEQAPRGRCGKNSEHPAHYCDGMPCGDWRGHD